jgi:hypothetical protein
LSLRRTWPLNRAPRIANIKMPSVFMVQPPASIPAMDGQ